MFTNLFVAALIVSVATRMWLARRQVRHVRQFRPQVPARFAESVSLAAHQKAADYTVARTQLAIVEVFVGAALLLVLTLMGALQWLDQTLGATALLSHVGVIGFQISLILLVTIISSAIDLPFSLYRQFRLEARFGFNKMTFALFVADLCKGALVGAIIGIPLLWAVLWLMMRTGSLWWFYTWLVWIGFNLLMQVLYPTVIAPLFNKFVPLSDDTLKSRIDALLARTGFSSNGVFVMDGSRRSAHGNAYFTGFGSAKRIVFFDTLLARLSPSEIEAVLAHELGHFKRHHVLQRILFSFAGSLAALALLGWLVEQSWFFAQLGTDPSLASHNAVALLLFVFVLPVFTFLLAPLMSLTSRRHEYQADAFAAAQTNPRELVSALVKLYEDNASTLTPDPLHSAFYDSHPPASLRIRRLDASVA